MNALELLHRQHEELRFALRKLRELRNLEARRRTVAGIARLLRAHATLEEEQLYPSFESDEETADLVDVAFRDHEHLGEVLGELERCRPDDPAVPGILNELEELLEEHFDTEENRLFPLAAESWPALRLLEVGRAMAARFAELTASAERPALDPDQVPEV
jgi:hypothetical protein